MASTINALTGSGGVAIDGDATGVLELQSAGTTIATVSSTGLAMASGKTIAGNISYPARAWVNFNGTLAAASMIQARHCSYWSQGSEQRWCMDYYNSRH